MSYVSGFIVPVPAANRDAYRRMAEEAAPISKENGAERMVECWGDDVPDGKETSFPMAVKLQPDEVAVFSWIWWPSKDARDAGMAKVMEDPRMKKWEDAMPFDGKRMIFGGFEVIVDA